MKARFLFATWPFPGHLYPQIAIASALCRLGHECAFYCGKDTVGLLRDEGFRCFPFSHLDEAGVERLMSSRPSEPWRITNASRLGALLREWLIDTIPDQIRDIEGDSYELAPAVDRLRSDDVGADAGARRKAPAAGCGEFFHPGLSVARPRGAAVRPRSGQLRRVATQADGRPAQTVDENLGARSAPRH